MSPNTTEALKYFRKILQRIATDDKGRDESTYIY